MTVVVESALTRGGLAGTSDESPAQRIRILKCDDCGEFTRSNAL
ncbi:hypothetical protein [Halogeometricum salsisoli]|nr:hypothetical protein [Halogeometricum sp. S1BR25-6]